MLLWPAYSGWPCQSGSRYPTYRMPHVNGKDIYTHPASQRLSRNRVRGATIRYPGRGKGGAGVFVAGKLFISTGLGGALKISHFINVYIEQLLPPDYFAISFFRNFTVLYFRTSVVSCFHYFAVSYFRSFVLSLFTVSQFRTFVVSYLRCFVLALFRTFAVSYFRCFVLSFVASYFRCFAVWYFPCFVLSLFYWDGRRR